ncbi:MAG: hypothetical protein HQL32_13120 [Planctomycetes bacterium]|nr:hypothetical protein [Planctomycetota bacterium]
MTIPDAVTQKIDEIIKYVGETHGIPLAWDRMESFLGDRACVFYPVKMVYDADPLQEGEFAYMHQVDKDPGKGFMLYMHSEFKDKHDALPCLIAYHIAVVNFGVDVHYHIAESLGARLMSMDVDDYYNKALSLYESLPASRNEA